jgi:hypothetical protein
MANVQGDKYSCQNLVTDEIEYYHVTRLRELDSRDIALRDRDEFYVEKILVHHGDIGRLKTVAFHVKWRGFDESFNSWETWKNLRETEMLHRYLILHGLQKLIPSKFREPYPELAVGRRRRRQDVAANEVAQMVSTVRLESSLWSSDTWAGKLLKTQKKYRRKITFAEDLVILLSGRFLNTKPFQAQDFSKTHFVIICELCACYLFFCTLFGKSTGRPLADVRLPTGPESLV